MTIDEAYSLMKFIINNNQLGNLSPDSFNLIINQSSFSYLNYLLGELQRYMPGRPIAAVEWGQTARIREALTPFIQPPTTLTIDGATGQTLYPPNYEMWDAMYHGIYKNRVKFIQQGRLDSHLNSVINPISRNPVFLSIYNGFQVYPVSIGTTQLSYIRTPNQMYWGSTPDINNRPIYSPSLSVDPQWKDEDMLQVIVRALAMVGVNLQAAQVSQYAEQIKTQGQ